MCIGLVPENPWKFARKKSVFVNFREPISEEKRIDPITKEWVNVERIETKEGTLFAVCGRDYVIKGIQHELYPIDKKIFAKTYEILDGEKQK